MEKPEKPQNVYFTFMMENKDTIKANLNEGEKFVQGVKR